MADPDITKDKLQAQVESEDLLGKAEDFLLPATELKGEEDREKEEFEEDENQGVPTDKGYSWVIVACVLLSAIFTVGHNRSLSALFVDISEEFKTSTTVTSLTYTFYTATIGLSNLVTSNILLSRINVRTICVVAGFLNGMTSIAIASAPNITAWLCLYAVKGVFFGALIVPPMAMIGYYFKKRRSLASAIASTGVVVAYIAFPPFATFLRIQFGLRGALLIIGAIELHEVAVGMLMRPVSSYKKFYLRRRGTVLKKIQPNRDNLTQEGQQLTSTTDSPSAKEALAKHHYNSPHANGGKDNNNIVYHEIPKSECFELTNGTEARIVNADVIRSDDSSKVVALSKSLSQHSVHSAGASIAGSMLDIVPVGVPPSTEDRQEGNNNKKTSSFSCTMSTFIDTTLLKTWKFRMTLGYMTFSSFINFIVMYMPTIAYHAGIGKADGAFLLTISGCTDLVTRVLVGFIADKKIISKENLIVGSLSVIVVVTQFARYYTTYSLFVMFSLLIGIFSGFRQNLLNPLMLDYFGAEKAPKALGILATVITLNLAVNHPVLGALVDLTGSFTASLHYVGANVFVSIFILLTHRICKRWDEEKKKKEEEEAKTEEKLDLTDKA